KNISDTMIEAMTLILSSLCRALIIANGKSCAIKSNISSQAGWSDVFQCHVCWSREGVDYSTSDLFRRDHFTSGPFAFDVIPDVRVSRRRVNVDHANFSIAQFFADGLRESFKRKLAHAIGAPVRK